MSLVATELPVIVRDSRFRAGRTLVTRGEAERAVEIFETLHKEAQKAFGDDHLETSPAYYEYGNALFRAAQRAQDDNGSNEQKAAAVEGGKDAKAASREAAAAAAERRAAGLKKPPPEEAKPEPEKEDVKDATKDSEKAAPNECDGKAVAPDSTTESSKQQAEEDGSDSISDEQLALELMEAAWSILDRYQENPSSYPTHNYTAWAKEQAPRFLTGIGDVLAQLDRHADATDAYCRALRYREDEAAEFESSKKETKSANKTDEQDLLFLKCRRRFVETCVLIAEELLACPPGQDVVTTETEDMLVSAEERVDYAKGYYDKARDGLQEAVMLMGDLVARGAENIQLEKENVCFASTLVMSVGEMLAEIDEKASQEDGVKPPSAKKQKR